MEICFGYGFDCGTCWPLTCVRDCQNENENEICESDDHGFGFGFGFGCDGSSFCHESENGSENGSGTRESESG